MSPEPYGWQPFDPDDDPLPPSLADEGRDEGEVVVLAGPGKGLELDSWARETATALARRWSSATERLFLMDLDLEEPGLHQILGLENEEGATDVFLFGSSLQRIARSIDGGAFYFASAGTATADPESVLQNDRWDRLIQGFRDAGARLVLYLPLTVPGSLVVLQRADRIVVLGRADGADDERLSELDAAGTVFLCPPETEELPAADVEADVAPTPDDEVEDTADLASDDEVVDIADLAPDEEVVEIASLAPDEEVASIADLAPDEEEDEEVGERPSAPRGSVPVGGARADEGTDEPIVDIEVLAPDEPAIDEAVPTPSPTASEVMDIADLAPDAAEPEPAPEPERSPEPEIPEEPGLPPEPEIPAEAEASAEPDPAPEPEPPIEPDVEHDASVPDSALADVGGDSPDRSGEESGDPVGEEPSGRTVEEPLEPAPESHGQAEPDGGMTEPEPEEKEEVEVEDLTPEEADVGPDADEFADFDLGSLDAAAEAADEGIEDQQEDQEADFGAFPEALDEEASEEEPAEEEALGFGDFDGELEEEPLAEEPAEEDEGAPDFGDFDGEVEEETDAAEADEGDGEMDLEPSFAEKSGGPAEPDDATTEDFGNDLVTGPDFGGGAPEEEAEWESEDPSAGEEPAEEPRAPTAGVSADDEGATGSGREPRGTEEAGEGREQGREQEGEKPARPGRDRSSGRPVRLALLLFLVMAAAAAGHWFGVVRVPGLDRALASFLGPAATGPAPVVETTNPSPTNPILGYSLALDSYRNAQSAGEVGSALSERLPDRLFLVAPIQANGEVLHRLLAGPARNAEEAGALRETLAAVLTREDPDDWAVRATPLAFVVEETPSLESARSRASTLREQGVSVYVLQVTYPDDGVRYRVYAGAYETPEEARAMQGILGQAGASDVRFTERRGRLPE